MHDFLNILQIRISLRNSCDEGVFFFISYLLCVAFFLTYTLFGFWFLRQSHITQAGLQLPI